MLAALAENSDQVVQHKDLQPDDLRVAAKAVARLHLWVAPDNASIVLGEDWAAAQGEVAAEEAHELHLVDPKDFAAVVVGGHQQAPNGGSSQVAEELDLEALGQELVSPIADQADLLRSGPDSVEDVHLEAQEHWAASRYHSLDCF